MERFKYIGQGIARSDALEKVTGKALFAADMKVPNMLYGKILRSPFAHARIKRVDPSAAEKIYGVKAVLTRDDIDKRFNPYGRAVKDQDIVAIDKVRYIGDPVAAIAAVDICTAEEALSLIKVEYEELPPIFTIDEAIASNAPLIHDKFLVEPVLKNIVTPIQGTNICNHSMLRHGDIEKGFRESDFVFEDIFTTEPNQHGALELHSSIASVFPGSRIEVISNNQTPSNIQVQLSQVFNLPQSSIRIIVPTLGGGFGSKLGLRLEPLAIALAIKAGRPVKVMLSREEEFFTVLRHGSKTIIKTGVKRDGTIMAREMAIYLDTGAYADFGPIVSYHTSHTAGGPYRIPHLKIDTYCVYTNKVPAGAMRGFGVPQASWAYEQQIDIIAAKLKMDSLEIRRKNIIRSGDIFHTGIIMEDMGFDQVLEKTAAGIGWTETQTRRVPIAKYRGKGISVTLKGTATPTTSAADVKMNSDGSTILICNTVEMGQGSQTILRQILAEALGLPLEKVAVQYPDTNVAPFDFGTFSSRSTFHMGNATLLAAENLKKQLLASAAIILDAEEEDLIFKEGFIQVKNAPNRSVSFAQAVIGHGVNRGSLKSSGLYQTKGHMDKETGQSAGSSFWMEGGGGAEVEVDMETGLVETIKYIGVTDVGKAINPVMVEQQISGCIVMGLGGTFTEQIVYNEQGLLLNPNFIDYKIPTVKDLPNQMIGRFIEVPSRRGPYGAKGIAEASLMPPMPAIANAIHQAIGVRIKDFPITPEKILRNLSEKEQ
jgi:CO/xanthine dehydrogenase Mo-binding subunit